MFDSYIYDKVADRHSFNIENVDLGIINSIRRVILSEIPVVAFYGEEHPTVDILYNNTPLHNEYMIHRIGLIPLNIKENITENYEDNDYTFELNKENNNPDIKMLNVTTADFTGSYKDKKLSTKELNEIFQPNSITKDHILITRLRLNEKIHLKANAIKRTAKLNSSFSPVSLSNFYFVVDENEASKTDNILDKERSYIKNKYGEPSKINFQIETINGLSYKYLFNKAIEILIEKLENIILKLDNKEIEIEEVPNIPNSFNFKIEDEDDTLGNLIQSILHNKYIRENSKLNDLSCDYVGYICPHPLIKQLIVRFTLSTTDKQLFYNFFSQNCRNIIKIMDDLKKDWVKFAK
jgi:DNA-directed RNA polymerase subunit L